MGEWLIILVIVVIVFGAAKLPQLGDGLGRAIRNFKKAASGADELDVTNKKEISAGERDHGEDADLIAPRKTSSKKS
jgi:sec-independent protein translocase protein TatA